MVTQPVLTLVPGLSRWMLSLTIPGEALSYQLKYDVKSVGRRSRQCHYGWS